MGSTRSVVQFEGVNPEAAPRVAYAQIEVNGEVGIILQFFIRVSETEARS